jgi:hypothetical protein
MSEVIAEINLRRWCKYRKEELPASKGFVVEAGDRFNVVDNKGNQLMLGATPSFLSTLMNRGFFSMGDGA